MSKFSHISVMLYETVDGLNIKPDGVYVDGTTGGGGHSFEVASRLNENGRLYCFDRDPDAIKSSSEKLSEFKNVTLINEKYSLLKPTLIQMGVEHIDGLMLAVKIKCRYTAFVGGSSYHSHVNIERHSFIYPLSRLTRNHLFRAFLLTLGIKYRELLWVMFLPCRISPCNHISPSKRTAKPQTH